MEQENKKLKLYEIKHNLHLGNKEYIIAEDCGKKLLPEAQFDEYDKYLPINDTEVKSPSPYLLTECTYMLGFPRYDNTILSNDYLEIMEEFTSRLQEQTINLQQERQNENYHIEPFDYNSCIPDSEKGCYENKVCIIKASSLYPEHRTQEMQLLYVTGGNGANPHSHGRGVTGYSFENGKHTRFDRVDVLGVADMSKLPEWALIKAQEFERKDKSKKEPER